MKNNRFSLEIQIQHTSTLTNGYCSSNQLISLSLSTNRTNDGENTRGVLTRISTVCVDSVIGGVSGLTGIRAGFDVVATDFITGGRRNGVCRANRLGGCEEVGGTPIVSCDEKRIFEKYNFYKILK